MTTEVPRLSPSIAKILLDKSPKHAWDAHRLLGGRSRKASASQDLGKAVDAMVFGGELTCTKSVNDKAEPVAAAVKDALLTRGIAGKAQHRIEWNYDGVDCSGVVDLFCPDAWMFYELKTIGDCSDGNIVKQIELYGYDLQYAAYQQGLLMSSPDAMGAPLGQFIFVETAAPYDVRFVDITPAMLRNGEERWRTAQNRWRECMRTNTWNGRGDFTADVSPYRKRELADDWINQ